MSLVCTPVKANILNSIHHVGLPYCLSLSFLLKNRSILILGALLKWRTERGWDPQTPGRRIVKTQACEHIVVLNKRDLVPEWGMEVCEAVYNRDSWLKA